MSRVKLATAALASSATAAGVLLCALAAGTRSRSEAERIREDEEQLATLAKGRQDHEHRRVHGLAAPSPGPARQPQAPGQ